MWSGSRIVESDTFGFRGSRRRKPKTQLRDRKHGRDRGGHEVPEWVANKKQRLAKPGAANVLLDAAHKSASAARRMARTARRPSWAASAYHRAGRARTKAHRNFTYPESRS